MAGYDDDDGEDGEVMLQVAEEHGGPMPASDLLSELEGIGAEQAIGNRLEISRRNERWVHGEQYSDADVIDEEMDVARFSPMSDVPQQYRNLLRNPWLAYTAMVLEEMPICKVYPNNASGIDPVLADVANKILDYADERNDAQDLWDNVIGLAQLHGTTMIKVIFDPTRDARGALEPGDIRYSAETIFDYWRDPTGDIEDARWSVCRNNIPRHVGVALALEYGLTAEQVDRVRKDDEEEAPENTCEVTEIWWRPDGPNGRFPDGLYLTFLGTTCLSAEPYPLEHGELPGAEIMITRRNNSPYATSHVDDAIMPQRVYNESVSIQSKLARDFRNTFRFTTPDIEEKLTEGSNDTFGVPQELLMGQGAPLVYVSPPPPSELLQHEEDRSRDHVYDAFGQSEMLMGSADIEDGARGPAGKTVAYYQWLRRQALGGVIKSVHKALRRIARQTISLFQQYASDDLILSIIGEDRYVDLALFRQADLRHIEASLKLEPSSTASRLRAEQAAYAAEQASAGAMDPARAAEIQRTGLSSTVGEQAAAAKVQALVRVAMTGAQVQPDPNIPVPIAIAELERLASAYAGYPNVEIIEQILAWYRSQVQQPQPGQPPQDPALVPGGQQAPPTPSTLGAPQQ